jgi:CheY-like chemotaxis protein
MLAVGDTGCGMNAETASHVFEPFFTTKGIDKGTGLGLSTVYGIVKQSDGEISVESEPGRGTRFMIFLPRVEDPVEVVGLAASGAKPAGGRETILLVEDEPEVRKLTREILELNGYTVLEAADGGEALRLGASHAGLIHLVITDVVMPHLGGRNLAEQMGRLRPDTRILYISGYTDDAVIRHGVLAAETAFLQKPFTGEALARKVREVLDGPSGADRPRALHVPQVVPTNGRETR